MTTWMLVEDEPDMYDMLLSLTETLGHSGLAFPRGPQAIEWIDDYDAGRLHEPAPELALIDVRLADFPGQQVSARLRQSPALKHIPILMISAYVADAKQIEELMRVSGANMFMKKPLPALGEFNRIVKKLLEVQL